MEERSLLLISEQSSGESWLSLFSEAGFRTKHCVLGVSAVTTAVKQMPDLIVVDCRYAESTALQVCQSLRALPELGEVPLFAICWDGPSDVQSIGSRSGVETLLTQPVSARELLAKFHSARAKQAEPKELQVLRYADLELDERRFKVHRNGQHIKLPMLQFRVLRYLMEHPGIVFSRRELLEAVWGDTSLDEGTVTVCLVRLRKALLSCGGSDCIRHVRGIGYSLDADFSVRPSAAAAAAGY